MLHGLLTVLTAVFLAAAVRRLLPKTYDNGTAEALYAMQGQTYQLSIAWADVPTEPFSDRCTSAAINFDGRYPSLIWTRPQNHTELLTTPLL